MQSLVEITFQKISAPAIITKKKKRDYRCRAWSALFVTKKGKVLGCRGKHYKQTKNPTCAFFTVHQATYQFALNFSTFTSIGKAIDCEVVQVVVLARLAAAARVERVVIGTPCT